MSTERDDLVTEALAQVDRIEAAQKTGDGPTIGHAFAQYLLATYKLWVFDQENKENKE